MVSGRFKRVGAPPPLTTKKTIVGFLILHIVVFTEVVDCRIYHETIKTPDCFGIDCYGIGSDQKLMSLTLTLPYHDSKKKRMLTLNRNRSESKAARTRFMVQKLKNLSTRDEFQQSWNAGLHKLCGRKVLQLKDQRNSLLLSTPMFIDQVARIGGGHDSGGSITCSLVTAPNTLCWRATSAVTCPRTASPYSN